MKEEIQKDLIIEGEGDLYTTSPYSHIHIGIIEWDGSTYNDSLLMSQIAWNPYLRTLPYIIDSQARKRLGYLVNYSRDIVCYGMVLYGIWCENLVIHPISEFFGVVWWWCESLWMKRWRPNAMAMG